MDVVGSEIGQKMRSAIKAKLTELGCYVDDELPDYVMVMVANKRTRAQMEDDLQLFLGDNTELFVNWLHQVLKKLQEVTVAAPKPPEPEKVKEKERSLSKDRKSKEKKSKEKVKKSDLKKAKKKDKMKEKTLRKKEQKKAHKKKKNKDSEIIRPNIPPLLMNMEKDSEPSITDVFAGQILKNHGILIETIKEYPKETKPVVQLPETKRPLLPIIDPATIVATPPEIAEKNTEETKESVSSTAPREEQIKEMNEIEAKIQGLRQKLAEQLDSMSEDEDFLNIRTEAEELMNDFAEDVFQEISDQTPAVASPPPKSPTPPPKSPPPPLKDSPETLPQIELNLPKRPVRERLGTREEQKKTIEVKKIDNPSKENRKASKSPESFTPERELEPRTSSKSTKTRVGPEPKRKSSTSDTSSEKTDSSSKRLTSRVSVLEPRSGWRAACASVVRVRPRPRVPAPASSLLLRAMADAHKSLLNIPPKASKDVSSVKRALVLPMRRGAHAAYVTERTDDADAHDAISLGEPDSDDDKSSKVTSDAENKDEYIPTPIAKKNPNEYGPAPPKKVHNEYVPGLTMKIQNTEYVPSRRLDGRKASRREDSIVIEAINIHNPTVGNDKNTQFIVTMEGFNPNAFLAKKLQTEGLLNDDDDKPKADDKPKEPTTPIEKHVPITTRLEVANERSEQKRRSSESSEKNASGKSSLSGKSDSNDKDNSSQTIKIVDTPIVIKEEKKETEKRKSETLTVKEEPTPAKKRRSSPIVFDVGKKEKEQVRERTESVGSDNHVTVTTTTNSHKYDTLPPLSIAASADKKGVWCRAFPQCRYGAACAFQHPRCKFAAACTRRSCPYSHSLAAPLSPAPAVASHVVPAANYKSISAAPLPAMCKYYPSCANAACHYYHPKPCRYGKMCGNKLECNFYHADVPATKWRFNVP